jgi:Zn-dependent M28 family amino/carboxypeptidase
MRTSVKPFLLLLCFLFLISHHQSNSQSVDEQKALELITPELIRSHLSFLSDDLLEGRGPATRGDRLAQMYIATQFALAGLEPGNTDGTYFQKVPIVGVKADPAMVLRVRKGSQVQEFKYFDEFVAFSGAQETTVTASDAEVVFVGYGIVAPEQNWDDFKNVNVTGKILLMLNDDPPSDDPKFFGGKARTYYGRWTYKFEIAARKGAAGAIIIHTTESAGYPWKVVQSSWSGEQFLLAEPGDRSVKIQSWVTEEVARKLTSLAGKNLDALRKSAESRRFKPVPLGVTVSLTINNSIRQLETANVLGLLRGSDPEKKAEVLVYTAHYDHFGIGKPVNGDSIYNGAMDNASGTSLLLSVMKGFAEGVPRPKRSVLFIALAAEEQGLLGSLYYAAHPTFPHHKIVANINIDGVNLLGPARDIQMIGKGRSTLDATIEGVAKEMSIVVVPDQMPELGFFYRSDQFNFAKVGIPAAYFHHGVDIIGKPPGWGKAERERFIAEDYHQPSDEMRPTWDYSGAAQQARFTFLIGYRVANTERAPEWNRGDEFEAARSKSVRDGR